MRNLVSAMLSFGLVNVPVGVASVASRKETSFKTLCKEDNKPIRMLKTCDECGTEPETVRGYEYASGQFVILTDEEIEEAKGESDKTIRITSFTANNAVAPVLIEKNYWLTPSRLMTDAYWLLFNALSLQDAVGVGSCALWGKETPCLIAPAPFLGLTLSPLFCADEVARTEFEPSEPSDEALGLLRSLVAENTKPFVFETLRSSSQDRLEALVSSKLAGLTIEPSVATPTAPTTDNLLESLKASLAETKPKGKVKA